MNLYALGGGGWVTVRGCVEIIKVYDLNKVLLKSSRKR